MNQSRLQQSSERPPQHRSLLPQPVRHNQFVILPRYSAVLLK